MPAAGTKILIVGANRGIGLQWVKSYITNGCTVTGTIRPEGREDPSVEDLRQTGAKILELDYTKEDTIEQAVEDYGDGPLDVLVNCGGVHVYPESWLEHTSASLVERFLIMTVGPFLTSKHFLPNLLKSDAGKIVNVSSDFGSVEENLEGECIAYRLAKTALNQQTVTIARELKAQGHKISLMCVNPGWVPTRMTKGKGNVRIEESVEGMIKLTDEMTLENTGQFRMANGETHAY